MQVLQADRHYEGRRAHSQPGGMSCREQSDDDDRDDDGRAGNPTAGELGPSSSLGYWLPSAS